MGHEACDLLEAFLEAKGEELQKAGAASVSKATTLAEGVVAMGLEFALRFRNYFDLLQRMMAWARDRPFISPMFGRQLLSKLAAHASDASAEVLGVESPRFGNATPRQHWDPTNIQVSQPVVLMFERANESARTRVLATLLSQLLSMRSQAFCHSNNRYVRVRRWRSSSPH